MWRGRIKIDVLASCTSELGVTFQASQISKQRNRVKIEERYRSASVGRFLYLAKVLEQKYQDCTFDSNTKTSLQKFFQYLEIAQEFLSCELSATTSSHSHGKLPPSFTRTPDSVSCRTWVSLLRSQEPANTIYSCSSKPEAS